MQTTSISFLSELNTLIEKHSLDTQLPDKITRSQENTVKDCINILNKIIKKRKEDVRGLKPSKQERKSTKLAELQKKKLAEKTFVLPQQNPTALPDLRTICYVCKGSMAENHFFYDAMCETCGTLNYEMRTKKRDLTGYTAIVTGGRIKIGYYAALWLLNNNCFVIVTTRFPAEALLRFQKEPNYEIFKDRLFLYGLDFKHLNKVSQFIEFIKTNFKEINILINNAAQTLYRTDDYNHQLLQDEEQALKAIQDDPRNKLNPDLLPLVQNNAKTTTQLALFENNYPVYDINRIPVDFSAKNSWTKNIEEIDFKEFAESQVINSWVPFIFCSNLKQIMTVPGKKSFIINVSAMEGKFDYKNKSSCHPHTNMAKAALNMLTRTCGVNFKKSNIYMTSIDTGWCSEMNPSMMYTSHRTVPLDEIDGAMRILHPIFDDLDLHSVLLKDYKVVTW